MKTGPRTVTLLRVTVVLTAMSTTLPAAIERYKDETQFLLRLSELGYNSVQEGFEGPDWDGVRSDYPTLVYAPSITSKRLTWESAGRDLWTYPGTPALITTNNNWARSGLWGIYDNYLASTKRITTPEPIYGLGFWVNTNPDGQDIGILFTDRLNATDPGYFLPGYGAMHPGDIHPAGHSFVGFIEPDGFSDVVITGTLEVNEEGILEGGTVFGADDFTFAVAPSFLTAPLENWRATHFSALDLADPTKEATVWGTDADPDGDGLANDGELALGTDPNDPSDGNGGVTAETSFDGSQTLITLTYLSFSEDPALTISPALSPDLLTWDTGPATFETLSVLDQGNGYKLITVRSLASLVPRTTAFARISITRSNP